MADPTPSDYHLTYLRERWERDRSSRVFLQLAEEYRRRGLLSEALEVLQVGLSHHPGYLAAQVSLGRCWLEAGKPEAAAEVLGGVLAQDPTQAVASRLLIDVWLRLGDAERARAALERCELLGVPPQELHGQRERLADLVARNAREEETGADALPAATQPAGTETAAAAAVVGSPEPGPVPPAPPASARPSPLPPPAAAAAAATGPARVFALPPVPASTLVLPARPAARRVLRVAGGDPFSLPRPIAAVPAAGAVFALGLAAAAPAATPPAMAARMAAPFALEAVAEPAPPPEAPLSAPESAVAAPPEAPPLEPSFVPAAEPEALSPAEPAALTPPEIEPIQEPSAAELAPPAEEPPPLPAEAPAAREAEASEPSPAEAGTEEGLAWWRGGAPAAPATHPFDAVGASVAATPVSDAEGAEVQPAGALPAPELRPSDPGTATLGELYLRQGHLREAGEIFHQVLARDPENETALRGLESIARRRTAELQAADLLPEKEPQVRGLTSRKILVLQRYLRRIRAAASGEGDPGNHVPRAAE